MGLFRKKESTHFERDEEGKVIHITRNGKEVDPQEMKMKTSKQLEQEYYKKHPEKKHPTMKRIGAGAAKLDKKIVAYNRRGNMMNPQRTGRSSGPTFSFTSPSRNNANPFGSMFDSGQPIPKKRKKPKTQYKIIGGKAYPIAGTGLKKKKSNKSKQRRQKNNDPFAGMGW